MKRAHCEMCNVQSAELLTAHYTLHCSALMFSVRNSGGWNRGDTGDTDFDIDTDTAEAKTNTNTD